MTNKSTDLISLPDYPTLQQLARSLWQNGSARGAAVLVGAGVSKNARRSGNDTLEPPLWWELLEQLKKRLYPGNSERAPSDALRIAEEYRTFFGQAGLDEFIRINFPDRSWLPGPLHRELLELPWTDVLTTNWDTLLERAAEEITEPFYTVVKTDADLTYARSPRIVKLHGTLGNRDPLIFAEEDYRTYPIKYAAFVNFARQIFIENELVLVGFSGDDPNFLQWAGWVRDHLGGNARRIYLAGNLGLGPAARKYLEAHNIAPIDFAPLVSHLPRNEQHSKAIFLFLDAMRQGKPPRASEWKRSSPDIFPLNRINHDEFQSLHKDDARAAEILKETTPILVKDRQGYPGWYLCPIKHRIGKSYLREEGFLLRDFSDDQFANADKLEFISELIWHHTIQIDPISGSLLKTAEQMINEDECVKNPARHAALLSAIIYQARWSDDASKFSEYVGQIEGNPDSIEEIRTYALYQQCLRARDLFNFELLAENLTRLSADEPIWQLRRAALYSEIGEYTRATKLIKDALSNLERGYRADRSSLWIKSCLAWASYIHDASQAWGPRSEELQPWEFQSLDINPKSELLYFSDRASALAKSKREDEAEIRPSFEIGVYREGKNTNGIPASGSLDLLYEFEYVIDHIGLPIRLNKVNICADTYLAVLEGAATPSFVWYSSLLRVLHSHYDRAFERYFGRLAVAQMSPELAQALISALGKSIDFWNRRLVASTLSSLDEDRARCIDFLRLQIVALSRLTVRMSEEEAHLSWTNARYLSTKEDLQHPWILEAINELLKFSFQALSDSRKAASIFEVIDLPLSAERNVDRRFAPDLISEIWQLTPPRSHDDARWNHRINQLIDRSYKDEPDRREAISRLSYLAKRNVLSSSENEKFAAALWSDCGVDGGGLPANTDLLLTAFAELPAPPGIDVVARIQERLFKVNPKDIMRGSQKVDTRDMHARESFIASFAHAREFGIPISAEIAAQIFDQVVSWRPASVDRSDSFGASFYESHNKRLGEYGGLLLSRSIVPSLSSDAYESERLSQLTQFLQETDAWTSAEALPYFAVTQDHSDRISATIRSGLASARSQRAGNAAAALRRWIELEGETRSVEVPRSLIEYTIMSIESGKEAGLHVLIDVIVKALDAGKMNDGDIDRVISALDGIRNIFQYRDVLPETSRAVTVSLIRASCVKLSSKLIVSRPGNRFLNSWLEEGRLDPLPEVRFSFS